MKHPVQIGDLLIDDTNPPVIVAELSGNHQQSFEKAIAILEAAARSGADAFKLQTYTPDTMTLDQSNGEFVIDNPDSIWHGATLYELYARAATPWEWHEAIFRRARELGILAFSTPFDETAVDFLEDMNVPCYKIASFENTDIPLIRKVASTGKPIMMSTGMATISELDESIRAAREAGCEDLILLKCTSAYPASADESNVRTIPHLRELFQCQVGLSDHTEGIGAAVVAVALGATVIEKHLTLDRSDKSVDSTFSLEPNELQLLVNETRRAWRALGAIHYGPTEREKASLTLRRSLYIVKDMRAGEAVHSENVRCIRPGLGLAPKYIDLVIGRCVACDVNAGTPLTWGLLK